MSMREKIAQVLAQRDGVHPEATSDLYDGDEQTPVWHLYLDDADAVLDTLMEPTWEMEGAGIQTDEVDSIDWVEALRGTGITSAQTVVVASYKAMVRAAKEGK